MRKPPGIGLLIPRSAGDADIVDEADDETDDDIERGDVFGLSYRGRIAPGAGPNSHFLGLWSTVGRKRGWRAWGDVAVVISRRECCAARGTKVGGGRELKRASMGAHDSV